MSDPQNKVPFPQAGEGAHLRFRTMDYVSLRNKYGEPKVVRRSNLSSGFEEEVWETFTHRIDDGLGNFDPVVILDCLKAGLKQEDGRTPLTSIDYNDLPFSLLETVAPLRDAIVLALTNTSYAVLLAKQRADAERNARLRARGVEFTEDDPDVDPSLTPTTSTLSGESSGSDTPPAS